MEMPTDGGEINNRFQQVKGGVGGGIGGFLVQSIK
jgi:hypothetical protein